MTKELDKQLLIKIARMSETAEAVFTVLGARERARTDIDLRRLKNELVSEGFRVDPRDFEQTFAELAQAGIVQIKKEKGKAASVHFLVNPISVGQIGVDGRPARPALPPTTGLPTVAMAPKPVPRVMCAMLANGRRVKCELPEDMTREEARFVAESLLQEAAG